MICYRYLAGKKTGEKNKNSYIFFCVFQQSRVHSQLQIQMRELDSLVDILNHLILQLPQGSPHVVHLLDCNLAQQRSQLHQGRVLRVAKPRFYEYPIFRLQLEVLGNVVDYDRPCQVSSYSAQILNKDISLVNGVLSEQSVAYQLLLVQIVQHPVRVVRHRSRENHNFVYFAHVLQKLVTVRPHCELATGCSLCVVD